ncbi:hypothetical protein HI914_02590 [Erysiphe necator]|nr:hypothetical protein HI914_02590 [Erysiphe necator]
MVDTIVDLRFPILHYLNDCDSQSPHILWLLEELEIDHDLKLYSRDFKTLRESPVLVGPDGRVITESSSIATFRLKNFDATNRFVNTIEFRAEMISSFTGSTIGVISVFELFLDLGHKFFPWPGVHDNLTGKEMRLRLNGWRADSKVNLPLDLICERGWLNSQKGFSKLWERRSILKGNGYDLRKW